MKTYVVTGAQMKEAAQQARRLLEFCIASGITPFAGALFGVGAIQNFVKQGNGDIEWWADWVRSMQAVPPEWKAPQ